MSYILSINVKKTIKLISIPEELKLYNIENGEKKRS